MWEKRSCWPPGMNTRKWPSIGSAKDRELPRSLRAGVCSSAAGQLCSASAPRMLLSRLSRSDRIQAVFAANVEVFAVGDGISDETLLSFRPMVEHRNVFEAVFRTLSIDPPRLDDQRRAATAKDVDMVAGEDRAGPDAARPLRCDPEKRPGRAASGKSSFRRPRRLRSTRPRC